MPPEAREEHFADAILGASSRRGFLERAAMAIIGLAGAGAAARALLPDDADAYTNFCGHTYTTGNCPHPTGLPRVDRHDLPLRASDGHPVDDLGRPIDAQGYPVDAHGATSCANPTASHSRRRPARKSVRPLVATTGWS